MVNPLWDNIFRRKDTNSTQAWLSRTPIFGQLTPRELNFVEKLVHIRSYRRDEVIFRQGEVGVGMFLIAEGQVQIVDDVGGRVSLGAGDFFGELALVEEDSRRTASATSSENSKLIGFFKPDLEEIKQRNAVVGVKILSALASVVASRLRETIRIHQE